MNLSKRIEIEKQIQEAQKIIRTIKNNYLNRNDDFSDIEDLLDNANQKRLDKPVRITIDDFASFINQIAKEGNCGDCLLKEVIPNLEKSRIELKFCRTDEYGQQLKTGLLICIGTNNVVANWYKE